MPAPRDPLALPQFEQRCRELGIPLTVQRRAVLSALLGRTDHPTADDVYGVVLRTIPGVSRGTVYRTLDKLVELGLIVRVSHPGSAARYDAKLHRHHHLICERCGSMADLEASALDELALPDLGSAFRVVDYSVHLRGICRACARKPSGRRARNRT